MMDKSENEITFEEIVELFTAELHRGDDPCVEDFRQKYPKFEERIDAVMPALLALENVDSQPPSRRLFFDDSIPRNLGDYQILQEIGRGGMGIVFEAMDTTMHRRVALKVLPRSLANKSNHLERFLTEARSAGLLHHSNIVPVFEIAEVDGLHFYTMQYIHGDSLDRVIDNIKVLRTDGQAADSGNQENPGHDDRPAPRFELTRDIAVKMVRGQADEDTNASMDVPSNRNRHHESPGTANHASSTVSDSVGSLPVPSSSSTSLRQRNSYHHRVALAGIQVAQALQHAHRNGVLHRDIKPANLLLDADGNVWVTDFGLAKFETGNLTQTGDILGTLRYMAPERFKGIADPRSDIYSLGLTLYELCTLKCAFENDRGTSIEDVIARSGVVAPRSIDESIPPDLETIILKAIDVQPERRYQKAGDLAEDLELFLADRPIKARRITSLERLWRLCRRNPVAATLTLFSLILLLTIAIGSALSAMSINRKSVELQAQNDRAASHLALTEETIKKMLVRIGHQLTDVPRMEQIRHGLYSDALQLQNELLILEPDNPRVKLNTVAAHRRLAESQSRAGHYQPSLELLERTIELIDSLPHSVQERTMERARVHTLMGVIHRKRGNAAAAEDHLRQAIAAIDHIHRPDRDAPSYIQLAVAHRQLGAVQQQNGQLEAATESLNAAQAALASAASLDGDHHDQRMSTLADVLNSLAIVYRSSGQYDQAVATYRRVLDQFRESNMLDTLNVDSAHQVGVTALNLGNVLIRQRRHEEAAESYEQAATIFQRLQQDFPATATFQNLAARAQLSLGMIYGKRDDYVSAEQAYRQAIDKSRTLTAMYGVDLTALDTQAVSLTNLGNLLKKQNRIDEAIELFEQSIDLRKQHAELHPQLLGSLKSIALTQANLANLYIDQREYELAQHLLSEAEELVQRLLTGNSKDPTYVQVANFVYSLACQTLSQTRRHAEVVGCIERRMQLPDAGWNVALQAVGWLKRAAQALDADDSIDAGAKTRQLNDLAQYSIGMIQKAIDSGWTPEAEVNEAEQFQWLKPYAGFEQLMNNVGDAAANDGGENGGQEVR